MHYKPFERYHLKRLDNPIYDDLAKGIKNIQADYNNIDSVLELGCSCGMMLNKIDAKTRTGLDYDIPKSVEKYHQFAYYDHDLNRPPLFIREYSLIICQEVIEHILHENEDNVLETIDLNSHEHSVLVFSGAIPGQPGRLHINCQTVKYWEKKLNSFGFYYNKRLTRLYKNPISPKSMYHHNTLVYIKKIQRKYIQEDSLL